MGAALLNYPVCQHATIPTLLVDFPKQKACMKKGVQVSHSRRDLQQKGGLLSPAFVLTFGRAEIILTCFVSQEIEGQKC